MRMTIILNFIFYAIVNLINSTLKWLKHIVRFHLKEFVGKLNDFRLSFGLFFYYGFTFGSSFNMLSCIFINL
ncbi:hypothetical protein Hanom_Chr08g00700031 [Helianthus anomalus]